MSWASQSHSSRRGGRWSSRSDFLTARTDPFRRVTTNGLFPPVPDGTLCKSNSVTPCVLSVDRVVPFLKLFTPWTERAVRTSCRVTQRDVQSQHAGNSTNLRCIFPASRLLFLIFSLSRGCLEDLHGSVTGQ